MGLPETVLYSDFTETFRADGLFKAWLLLDGLLPRNHGSDSIQVPIQRLYLTQDQPLLLLAETENNSEQWLLKVVSSD